MKEIQMTQNHKAMISDEDFKLVSRYKWYLVLPVKSNSLKYAAAKNYPDGMKKTILMHRIILSAPKGISVDHIDGNGLNNQRSNLRLCTIAQNNANSKLMNTNKTGFRGVCWHKGTKKFRAYISQENKTLHIGLYKTAKEAAVARNKKSLELRGEFAVLNEI